MADDELVAGSAAGGGGLAVGLTASLLGNAVIGASQCLQKYAVNRLLQQQQQSAAAAAAEAEDDHGGHAPVVPRWRDPLWCTGLTLNILGELCGNFVALSYTSAAVVAPLGAVALVINGVLAKVVLQEPLDRESAYGYTLLIVGVLVLLWAAPHDASQQQLTNDHMLEHLQAPAFVLYAAFILCGATYLVMRISRNRVASLNSYVLLAAIFGALTLISSKAVSVSLLLTLQGQGQLLSFLPYVFMATLATAAISLEFVKQAAITIFDASRFWPLFFAAFNLVSITLSLVLSQEIQGPQLPGFAWRFLLGLGLIWQGSLHVHGSSSSGSFLISAVPLRLHAWLLHKSHPLTWNELGSEMYDGFVKRLQLQPISESRP